MFFFQKLRKNDLKPSKINGLNNHAGELKSGLKDMLFIASAFYEKLYSCESMNEDIANTFLDYVQPISTNSHFLITILCSDFTEEELFDAIMSFKNGKSPGLDGISIEFYKIMYSVIKNDLLCVYNCILDQEIIPTKMKNGLITLIPKGEPSPNIENYRGITLNNVDLKILSKMLHNRLAPYLEESIHSTQFSVPGKREWELNTLIRDIYQEMENECDDDCYFVRIDFRKAFDSVNMDFLYKVMHRMGLPSKFIAIVKAIDSDVFAKVLVNGAKSAKFKVLSGTRQGDPLSMDKFVIALNPLILALNDNKFISRYKSKSNKEFLTLAKADDLTVVTDKLSSLLHIKYNIQRFRQASGLTINMDKTKGFFFNRRGLHRITHLPFNHWNENIIVLGIPFGDTQFIKSFWKEKFEDFDKDAKYFQSFQYLTLQAKAVVSKSKLMPKLSYYGSVLPVPFSVQEKINDTLLRFIVPHKKTFLKVENLAARKTLGGIGLANINLHCNIMLIRSVMFYLKQRDQGEILTDAQYYLEYNLGHQLSNMWNLPINNMTPHCFPPNEFYKYVLDILKMLKRFGVTKEEMLSGKVKLVYNKVVEKVNDFNQSPRWALLHHKLLPNYLISFNYKIHFNLFPVKSKFCDFQLDNDSRCSFCKLNYETLFHIMGKCVKLRVLWDFLDELMAMMNIDYNFSYKRTVLYEFEVMNIKCQRNDIKTILYLTTIVNYHLWKTRNRCVQGG